VAQEDQVPQDCKRVIQYIDTHAMEPMNQPVPPTGAITALLANPWPPVAPAHPIAVYRQTLIGAAALQVGDQPEFYPTHFVHAALAAQAQGCSVAAWLFENDPVKRLTITGFLAAPPQQLASGLNPLTLHATLAPGGGGNHGHQAAWPPVQARPGRALIVMNDPKGFRLNGEAENGNYMNSGSLRWLRRLINERYAPERPNLTVNVIFLTNNVGVDNPNAYQNYAQQVSASWAENFVPPQAVYCACRCVKWGAFMVLMGAYLLQSTAWNLALKFENLCQDAVQAIGTLPYGNVAPALLP
jgi:hypothetical protein